MSTDCLIDLSAPPVVASQGRGRHGVRSAVDEFRLPTLWQLHLYDWAGELEVLDHRHPVTPGMMSLIPPATTSTFRYRGPSEHLYAHLAIPPRAHAELVRLPVMQPLGEDLQVITELMLSAVSWATSRPERTRSEIWAVLWRLADLRRPERPDQPDDRLDHVRRATSWIEQRLSRPVTVPEIAAAAGISHHHLTRLFRAELGCSVIGYLRRRRIDHAQHLLQSTTMSIGAIAATVGIADLQAFNKTCRAITGRSPRQLREERAR